MAERKTLVLSDSTCDLTPEIVKERIARMSKVGGDNNG